MGAVVGCRARTRLSLLLLLDGYGLPSESLVGNIHITPLELASAAERLTLCNCPYDLQSNAASSTPPSGGSHLTRLARSLQPLHS